MSPYELVDSEKTAFPVGTLCEAVDDRRWSGAVFDAGTQTISGADAAETGVRSRATEYSQKPIRP